MEVVMTIMEEDVVVVVVGEVGEEDPVVDLGAGTEVEAIEDEEVPLAQGLVHAVDHAHHATAARYLPRGPLSDPLAQGIPQKDRPVLGILEADPVPGAEVEATPGLDPGQGLQ